MVSSSKLSSEPQTYIRLWDMRDPAKAHDPTYWVEGQASAEGSAHRRPRHQTLKSFLAKARDGNVEVRFPTAFGLPPRVVCVPIARFPSADPEHTWVLLNLIRHRRREDSDEQIQPDLFPFPEVMERDRQQAHAAAAAGDTEAAGRAWQAFSEHAAEHGFQVDIRESRADPFEELNRAAVEIAPGVFLVDERPSAHDLLQESGRLAEDKRVREAMALLDELIGRFGVSTDPALDQTVAYALLNKALLLRTRGVKRFSDAVTTYDELLSRVSELADPAIRRSLAGKALYGKGTALAESGRYDDAIQVLNEFTASFAGSREPGMRLNLIAARFARFWLRVTTSTRHARKTP